MTLTNRDTDKSDTLSMTNQQRYSEAVHIIMTAQCNCGADAAVKHGDLIYCAGCWLDK